MGFDIKYESWKTDDWLIRDIYDDELFRYRLFGYMKGVHQSLDKVNLFPLWEDLGRQYRELNNFEYRLNKLLELSPKEIKGLDKMQLTWKTLPDQALRVTEIIQSRLELASAHFKNAWERSDSQRLDIQKDMIFEPIGIITSHTGEGLLLLKAPLISRIWSWYYQVGIQKNAFRHSAVNMKFIGAYEWTLSNGLTEIKKQSLHQSGLKTALVNTWYAESKTPAPVFTALKQIAVLRMIENSGI